MLDDVPQQRTSERDHDTWSVLFDAYRARLYRWAAKEVVFGFESLQFDARVPLISDVSDRLHALTGWRLQPVTSLASDATFMRLISEQTFPVSVRMRKPEEIQFSELPDTFHDMLGHIPLLLNPQYQKFLGRYSYLWLRHARSRSATKAFARLYWYTLETGLIRENGLERVLGAAVLTSEAECQHAMSARASRRAFDVRRLVVTEYDNLKLQPWYFVIESMDDLLESLDLLAAHVEDLGLNAEGATLTSTRR